jgi:hypothetical protein
VIERFKNLIKIGEMKFVKKLTKREQQALEQMRDKHPKTMTRKRAHSLLLSSDGYRLVKISEILGFCTKCV